MKYTSYDINLRYHNYTQSNLSTLRTYFLTAYNEHSAESQESVGNSIRLLVDHVPE